MLLASDSEMQHMWWRWHYDGVTNLHSSVGILTRNLEVRCAKLWLVLEREDIMGGVKGYELWTNDVE